MYFGLPLFDEVHFFNLILRRAANQMKPTSGIDGTF